MTKKRDYDKEYNVEYDIKKVFDPFYGDIYIARALIPNLNEFCVNMKNDSERLTKPAFALLKQTVKQFIKRHERKNKYE